MLTKNKIKLIQSLSLKKNRKSLGLFIAEGEKITQELIHSKFEVTEIYSTTDSFKGNNLDVTLISDKELQKISSLTHPNKCLCLVKIPINTIEQSTLQKKLSIALDNIQDPGNLGTIIRIADWFGIENIICSSDCVDNYNPKVIQATMGAITRVNISYSNLSEFLTTTNIPTFGAFLEGDSIYELPPIKEGIIVIGNEGNGISSSIEKLITKKITIPAFGESESLNAAVSSAVIISEFKRKEI